MLSIGELSRVTALTVKTLRHYHERGLLVPTHIDPSSGYRYYSEAAVERAKVIKALKELAFSLSDIATILEGCEDDADAMRFLESQRVAIGERLAHLRSIHEALDTVIQYEKENRTMTQSTFDIEDKTLPPQLVAGLRQRGRYSECRETFKLLGKQLGMNIGGKAGMLIYDEDYKEDDADFEPFFPVKKDKAAGHDIVVRELPAGRALCLMYQGPYEGISQAYQQLFGEIRKRGLKALTPTREVYHKGPGMLFAGNPQKYLTEVQIPVE